MKASLCDWLDEVAGILRVPRGGVMRVDLSMGRQRLATAGGQMGGVGSQVAYTRPYVLIYQHVDELAITQQRLKLEANITCPQTHSCSSA